MRTETKWISMVAFGVLTWCAAIVQGAVQPNLDNVYGNSVTLMGGVQQTVWDNSYSEAGFLSVTYAVDGESPDNVAWVAGDPDARVLRLVDQNTWADGSATWKFVAPAGAQFAGGTVVFQGTTIWDGVPMSLQAHSVYSNNGWGYGGYVSGNGVLYNADVHAPPASWVVTNWTVNVPTGVSEFYVTAAERTDWNRAYGMSLTAYNVTTTVPEPSVAWLMGSGLLLLMVLRPKASRS